ncbi:MAG TPA: hypothetical protein VHU40_00780 [Polyangia bacterium]|nr:hypothetical protein [Polyangia bacterium]
MAIVLGGATAVRADDARAAQAPQVDPASVVLFVDQGRIELAGQHLDGMRLRWQAGGNVGEDVCPTPKTTAGQQHCAFGVAKGLDREVGLDVLPASAPGKTGDVTHASLRIARVVLDRLLPAAAAVDLTNGVGRIALLHPEAVASADCGQARCELAGAAVQVGAVPGAATALTLRLRLAPRFAVLGHDDVAETVLTRTVAVVHCQAAVISGPPPRHAEATRIIVRLDSRCGAGARDLQWTLNGDRVRVERTLKEGTRDDAAVDVQLGVGDIEDAQITLMASRPEPDGSVIAIAHQETAVALQVHAALDLPGFGKIDFVPTNREAVLRTAPPSPGARLVPVPVEGAYRVRLAEGKTYIQAEEGVGGFATLRFGYRVDGLPAAFAGTDLGTVTEPLQRPIREASVPAPLASSLAGDQPLLELRCADASGKVQRIPPGAETSIPFGQRDSCRLLIHRERLKPEDGTQDIAVDVAITKVDDSPRADAHQLERMVIRAAKQPRTFWIHGVKAPFDRLSLRVSHIIDEDHDVGGSDLHVSLPAAQWAVVAGQARLRFYATAAIPTGLYRITAPSDVLTLNFGALSRLTWLDRQGHEGLVGLEAGALGIGLAATPNFPRTLAMLAGIGVAVPIGNRGEASQASVNLHAWIAYELRNAYVYAPDAGSTDTRTASHWSFLFGPSITIGNIGTDL